MTREVSRRRVERKEALANRWRIGALVILSLAACSCGQAPDVMPPLILTAADVYVVGSSESVAEVLDVEVLPDGTTWVLNAVEPLFIGFDAAGRVIGSHGKFGGGPEEFRSPAGLLQGGLDGEAWVFDSVRHAFLRVSVGDGAWAEVALPREDIPPGSVRGGMSLITSTVRTARLADQLIVPWTTGTVESGIASYHMSLLGANLAAMDPRTGSVHNVVSLGAVLEDPSVGFVPTDGGFPLWYRLWAACGDHLRVYDRGRNQLRGFTLSGEELGPIDLPAVRLTEVTPVEFARAVFPLRQAEVTGGVGARLTSEDSVRIVNQVAQKLTGRPDQLAAYLPRYVDFRCSDDGTMWVQPIDLDAGGLQGSARWWRITPDGATREVQLPERFDAFRFTPERIWGVQRDELDVSSVAWVNLAGS